MYLQSCRALSLDRSIFLTTSWSQEVLWVCTLTSNVSSCYLGYVCRYVKVKYLPPLSATVVRHLAPIACMGYCSRTVESGAVWLHNTHEILPFQYYFTQVSAVCIWDWNHWNLCVDISWTAHGHSIPLSVSDLPVKHSQAATSRLLHHYYFNALHRGPPSFNLTTTGKAFWRDGQCLETVKYNISIPHSTHPRYRHAYTVHTPHCTPCTIHAPHCTCPTLFTPHTVHVQQLLASSGVA